MKRILLAIDDSMYEKIQKYRWNRKLNVTEYIRLAIFMQTIKDSEKYKKGN